MLANILAVVIGLGSLGFYLAAFILPEVHRRSDFFWSGVGMFYAVVLWYCAKQINGAVLLGQTASVGLLLWLGYQTLLLRRETTPSAQQTPIRLGKSERHRLNGSANRPIAKDYEFVEDGVEDSIERVPDPDSPILIKPAEDEFALKMVVPAAIPQASTEPKTPPAPPAPDTPAVSKTSQKRARPNPIAVVGIFAGWLRDLVTPQKKEPTPMIELPPRPPSIPKQNRVLETAATEQKTAENKVAPSDNTPVAVDNTDQPPAPENSLPDSPKPVITEASASKVPPSPAAAEPDEESNWPEDDFWE